MGIQGKGIFGGFSGKVGKVQGIRKNGKDTIQSLPKFKTRVNNFIVTYEPLQMVELLDVTVGLGFCSNDTATNSRLHIASAEKQLDNHVGGFEWVRKDVSKAYYVMFNDVYITNNERDYELYIWCHTSITRIRVDFINVFETTAQKIGEIFAMRWIDGELWFMRDDNTGILVKIYKIEEYHYKSMQIWFSMFTAGSMVDNIKIGKPQGEFILK